MSSRRIGIGALGVSLLASVVLILGWKLFWFQSDDAYISFRYIDNHIHGHGYVWNPPPFRPVEGYTNFLWIVVLEGVWRLLGIAPPESCNGVSLGFSLLSLALITSMALRLRLPRGMDNRRLALLGLVLLGIVTNRTVLAWTSSGLETAMFNFFILSWVYAALFLSPRNRGRLLLLAAAAALIYLTRPDGLLYAGATGLVLLLHVRDSPSGKWAWAGWLPLVAIPIHLGWRRSFYGEWLPNSYYAKTAGMWPESGLRYLASFVLEYALWVWVLVLVVLFWTRMRGRKAEVPESDPPTEGRVRRWVRRIVVLAIIAHLAYYILVVGGDHFEYRVLSHLVPLLLVSLVWMLSELRASGRTAGTVLALAVVLSLPIPTIHFMAGRTLETRDETFKMRIPVAEHLPPGIDLYGKLFDRLQFWLIDHYVCMRHQEHKVNLEYTKTLFPTREEAKKVVVEGYPIMAFPAVGYVSWVLPQIAILDTFGLNDYVVARTPLDPAAKRRMAHDRVLPRGYLECLAPNVVLGKPGTVAIRERYTPMTADRIRECETQWAAAVADLDR